MTLPQPLLLRVHEAFVVSLDKVRMIDGNTVYLHNKEISVGKTYREQLYQLIREV